MRVCIHGKGVQAVDFLGRPTDFLMALDLELTFLLGEAAGFLPDALFLAEATFLALAAAPPFF